MDHGTSSSEDDYKDYVYHDKCNIANDEDNDVENKVETGRSMMKTASTMVVAKLLMMMIISTMVVPTVTMIMKTMSTGAVATEKMTIKTI